MEQRVQGTIAVWLEPLVPLRAPKIFNLRTDPFERADTRSNSYWDWCVDRIFLADPTQMVVGEFLQTFVEFPPRRRPRRSRSIRSTSGWRQMIAARTTPE